MVELKLYVSEVDYEALIQWATGKVSGTGAAAIAMAARALPDRAKEEMAAKYINANSGKIEQMFENAVASKGVRMKISGAEARVVK